MLNNEAVDRVFQALAEPTRRAIVEQLSGGPRTVSDLAKPFQVTLAAIVQHLQVLEQSGLIQTEKVGRVRTCRIDPAGFSQAERWFADRKRGWERRFDRLGELLEQEAVTPQRPEDVRIRTSTTKKKAR